ncbi:MAG: hypothetical protein KatS3mg035_1261 [Bacteroidia bacterium]|nr:MAG: hypothetical protein KatS3mg035_1261 [Bacteroidia bacterium]
MDTSSFLITKIGDDYKVQFLRTVMDNNQENKKNTTFYLRGNDLKIYLIRSKDEKEQNLDNQNFSKKKYASQELVNNEIINFINMFYQYSDAQDIEGLAKCYDERVEKWFLESQPVTNAYIKQSASQYIKKVQNERTETYDYRIKELGNGRYEVQFKIDYSYEFRSQGIQKPKRKGVVGDVIMKLRRTDEDFKVYYLELKNPQNYNY